jgi:hypothetical protein
MEKRRNEDTLGAFPVIPVGRPGRGDGVKPTVVLEEPMNSGTTPVHGPEPSGERQR